MDEFMCAECGYPIHEHEWEQLALDETHVVVYKGRHCHCAVTIDDVYVAELVPWDGKRP